MISSGILTVQNTLTSLYVVLNSFYFCINVSSSIFFLNSNSWQQYTVVWTLNCMFTTKMIVGRSTIVCICLLIFPSFLVILYIYSNYWLIFFFFFSSHASLSYTHIHVCVWQIPLYLFSVSFSRFSWNLLCIYIYITQLARLSPIMNDALENS